MPARSSTQPSAALTSGEKHRPSSQRRARLRRQPTTLATAMPGNTPSAG